MSKRTYSVKSYTRERTVSQIASKTPHSYILSHSYRCKRARICICAWTVNTHTHTIGPTLAHERVHNKAKYSKGTHTHSLSVRKHTEQYNKHTKTISMLSLLLNERTNGWIDGWMVAVLPDKLYIEHESVRERERTNTECRYIWVWYACAWFASYVKSLLLSAVCRFHCCFRCCCFFSLFHYMKNFRRGLFLLSIPSSFLSHSFALRSHSSCIVLRTAVAVAICGGSLSLLLISQLYICDEVVCWECTTHKRERKAWTKRCEPRTIFFVSATQCVCNLSVCNKNIINFCSISFIKKINSDKIGEKQNRFVWKSEEHRLQIKRKYCED